MNIGSIVRKAKSAFNKRKGAGGPVKTRSGTHKPHGHTTGGSTEAKVEKTVKKAAKKL